MHAPDTITNMDVPTVAIKTKTESSLYKAYDMLRHDETVSAIVSAGSTGAVLTGAFLRVGRIKGVSRPALCPILPTIDREDGLVALTDSGANVDCKPINLAHFAIMGNAYLKCVYGIENPRVGVLNIGEEAGKGNELAQAAYNLLEEEKEKFNFMGNVEGRELFLNVCDVVVCDGFVGNVVLKVTEGTATLLFKMIKSTFKSDFLGMIVGLLAKPFLRRIYGRINYEEFGGCLLLGVKGITVISHGRSKAYAIKNAVRVAKNAVESQVNAKIAEMIS